MVAVLACLCLCHLFTLFTLLAYLNYTCQTPSHSTEPSDWTLFTLLRLLRLLRQSFLRLPCVFGTAVERRHVVMVSILSVDGYFVGAFSVSAYLHCFACVIRKEEMTPKTRRIPGR